MINALHAKLKRPEKGWDPVPRAHVESYGQGQWNTPIDEKMLDHIEHWVGGLKGKSVIDVGGGPAQYSVAFAKRGANVSWHDISATYRDYAKAKASENGVKLELSLGYMDDAPDILNKQFDVVFNRICWNYGTTDDAFARTVYRLVKPGGIIYIDTATSQWGSQLTSGRTKIRGWLNDNLHIKIGHPYPPRGRVAALLQAFPHDEILCDYTVPNYDRITMRRAKKS